MFLANVDPWQPCAGHGRAIDIVPQKGRNPRQVDVGFEW